MEGDVLNQIRTVLELGWPAIVLVMVVIVWRAYQKRVEEHISDLREIAGIKARLERLEQGINTPIIRQNPGASRPAL